MDDIQLYNDDCIEVMKTMPDKSVDAIITDLPYGSTRLHWDNIIPIDKMWKEVMRINKGVFITTAINPFAALLISSNPKYFRFDMVWHKNRATGFYNANRAPLRSHELILVFGDGLCTYNPIMIKGKPYSHITRNAPLHYGKIERIPTISNGDRYPTSVLNISVDSRKSDHPSEKPVALYEYLVRTFTNPNDIVLDITMGSGTTGVACVKSKRKFIGIELDDEYFDNAKKRIETTPTSLI